MVFIHTNGYSSYLLYLIELNSFLLHFLLTWCDSPYFNDSLLFDYLFLNYFIVCHWICFSQFSFLFLIYSFHFFILIFTNSIMFFFSFPHFVLNPLNLLDSNSTSWISQFFTILLNKVTSKGLFSNSHYFFHQNSLICIAVKSI